MYKKGTIVLTPFPFTDLSGSKVRPALIVADTRGDDVVVVFVTSGKGRKEVWDVSLEASTTNGLRVSSRIKCAKIATLEKKVILGELGTLSAEEQRQVTATLQKLFGSL